MNILLSEQKLAYDGTWQVENESRLIGAHNKNGSRFCHLWIALLRKTPLSACKNLWKNSWNFSHWNHASSKTFTHLNLTWIGNYNHFGTEEMIKKAKENFILFHHLSYYAGEHMDANKEMIKPFLFQYFWSCYIRFTALRIGTLITDNLLIRKKFE